MKRAQVQQVDEMSIQKLGENHQTIQRLTSQLQQLQEQMNSMNSSGEFQDIESNFGGRLSHVSSQPEMIPSSRALLSRDERLPLDTWNQSGFSTFDSPRDLPQRISSEHVHRNREAVPGNTKVKWRRTKLWHNSDADLCVRTVAYEFYNTGGITAELLWSGWQRQQLSELQFDKLQFIHNRSWCGKFDSKPKSLLVLIFHRMLCCGRWLILWTS